MNNTSTLILGIALIIIMWGMGLSLQFKDFANVMKYPKATIIGLTNQLVLLPIMGFLLIKVLGLSQEIAVGIMILSACPGGATSNLITHLAKGDTALSVTLTALASIITVITIPFVVNFSFDLLNVEGSVHLDVIDTLSKTFVIILLPVGIGMLVRRYAANFANKMEKPVKIASAALLFLIIVGIMVKEKSNLADYFQQAGVAAFLLNASTMLIGYFSAKLFRLNQAQATSISIESGIQNGTLALAIVGGLLNNTTYGIAPAIYSVIMFFTGGAVIFMGIKKYKLTTQRA